MSWDGWGSGSHGKGSWGASGYDSGKGAGKGKGKGGGKVKSWNSGDRSDYRGGGGDMSRVAAALEYNANREWEKDENEKWRAKEESDRKQREDEAAQRKKERDEMMERMEKLGDGFEKRMDKVVKRHVDDDDEPKTNKKKKKKEKVESEQDDDDDEEDWKAALRTPTKSQKPPAPVDPKEWKGWQCSAANAVIVKTHFGGGVADYKEDGILEVAETVVASATCPTKEELKAKLKKESKSKTQPPARWGRLELVTAVLAEVVKK